MTDLYLINLILEQKGSISKLKTILLGKKILGEIINTMATIIRWNNN